MKQDKSEKLLDTIYNNKWLLIRYFAVAIACAVLRTVFENVFIEWLGFFIWALIFYPLLKYLVYRTRALNVFVLLKQIMIYCFCIAGLWFTRQLFIGIIYMLCNNTAIAFGIGGAVNEVLCLVLMWKFVFKKNNV